MPIEQGKRSDNQFGPSTDGMIATNDQAAPLVADKGNRTHMNLNDTDRTVGKGTGDPKGPADARIIQGPHAMPLNKSRT